MGMPILTIIVSPVTIWIHECIIGLIIIPMAGATKILLVLALLILFVGEAQMCPMMNVKD